MSITVFSDSQTRVERLSPISKHQEELKIQGKPSIFQKTFRCFEIEASPPPRERTLGTSILREN